MVEPVFHLLHALHDTGEVHLSGEDHEGGIRLAGEERLVFHATEFVDLLRQLLCTR